MPNRRVLALVSVLSLLSSVPCGAAVIELRADYWCPFNCTPEDERPGFMVEVAREAMAMYGHEVNYEIMNWARSLEYARIGRVHGVIGTDPDEAPGFVFGPRLGTYREAFAFRRGEGRTIDSIASLAGLRLGGILDYDYNSTAVGAYQEMHSDDPILVQLLSGDEALSKNLKKLTAGRIDLVPEDLSVLRFTLANLGLLEDIELVLEPQGTDLFIAFSPALESSRQFAEELSAGVQALKQSGRFNEILARYSLTE